MGILLEAIYDLLVKPKSAFQNIIETKTLGQALQVFILSIILTSLGVYAGTFDGNAKIFIILLQIIFNIFIWGMSTAIWHLLAEILGEKGSAKQLLTATGFIYFLQILIVPFYLLATFWPTLGIAVVTITTICLAIWSLYLQIAAISVVYHMSMAKACLILFLPILIFIGVVIIMVISLSSFFISAANEFLVNPPQF